MALARNVNRAARPTATENLRISEGWMANDDGPIHRLDPFLVMPKGENVASVPRTESTSMGTAKRCQRR